MVTRLRRAATGDAEGIGAVIKAVWEQEMLREVCQAQIADDDCGLWVAAAQDGMLGFISSFLTMDRAGGRRWEVDLVAVRPDHQGEGLGKRLIKQAWEDGKGRDAAVARAVIRLRNLPSQKAFRRAGFTTEQRPYQLLLWPPQANDLPPSSLNGVSLLPVDTLTYRGLWIEGLTRLPPNRQQSVVGAARARVAREHRLNTGALVPTDRVHLLASGLRDQAKLQGEYYWYIKPFGEA